jgi:hypothetical protein
MQSGLIYLVQIYTYGKRKRVWVSQKGEERNGKRAFNNVNYPAGR